MIPESEVKAMLERAAAATPGPWHATEAHGQDTIWLDVTWGEADEELLLAETLYIGQENSPEHSQSKANIKFVAEARTELPRLAEAYLESQRCYQVQFNANLDLQEDLRRAINVIHRWAGVMKDDKEAMDLLEQECPK